MPVEILTDAEASRYAPDWTRWEGRRDRALLLVAVQTELRVSELTGLDCGDVALGTGANVRCEGKGRNLRAVPLTSPTQAVLRVWMRERSGRRDEPLFPTPSGRRLSTDAVERLVHKHAATAAQRCASIRAEKLHPHVLRHSCAMTLRQSGVDCAVIALWLGHADSRSTNTYLHADMTSSSERLISRRRPPHRQAATDPPTRCWRSSKPCNYAGPRPRCRAEKLNVIGSSQRRSRDRAGIVAYSA